MSGWHFPSVDQLRNIVYNSSFAFRAGAGSSLSSPVIRESRLATAVVVVNRVKQRVGLAPGWGSRKHGTESALFFNSGSTALSVPGNREALEECRQVAEEALTFKELPADDWMLWEGAQFYQHFPTPPPLTWPGASRVILVDDYGPMFSLVPNKYLGVYVDPVWLARRGGT